MTAEEERELLYWLFAQRIFGCGSAQPMQFFQLYGSMTAFFEQTLFSPKQELYRAAFLKRGEKSRLESIRPESCREILSRCREEGVSLLTPASPNYPECLRKIDAPPAVLYCKGELPPVDEIPTIAVVGSRKASPNSLQATRAICRQLAQAGAVVVSGGALGVDSAAHEGALDVGGRTLCLLPCAIDAPYLSSKAEMRRRILEQGGALLSEFPPGTEVQKWHFDVRNRLISGLSCGVLVAEAGVKSGTMLTVRHAAEQSRKIFTLPLGVWEENAEGMLRLLWDGAKPVSCAADILTEYQSRFPGFPVPQRAPLSELGERPPAPEEKASPAAKKAAKPSSSAKAAKSSSSAKAAKSPKKPLSGLSPKAQKLYAALSDQPVTSAELCYRTELPIQDVLVAALELELAGYLRSFSGSRYAKEG